MTDSTSEVPQFGALLAKYIVAVPESSRPRFLARLERGAADRYRAWAAALPDHAEVLLACAASEERIAIRVDALYPAIPSELAAIEDAFDAIHAQLYPGDVSWRDGVGHAARGHGVGPPGRGPSARQRQHPSRADRRCGSSLK